MEQGRRETKAVGKQMEMEVREELWRKCAMPAAGSLHRGELVAKPSLWEASDKIFCASFCAGKGGKALIYGHRLTSGEADADDRWVGRSGGLCFGGPGKAGVAGANSSFSISHH